MFRKMLLTAVLALAPLGAARADFQLGVGLSFPLFGHHHHHHYRPMPAPYAPAAPAYVAPPAAYVPFPAPAYAAPPASVYYRPLVAPYAPPVVAVPRY